MPCLTKARLTEGSGVKIALAFASGPPLPCSLDITSYQIYICNNKLTAIALSGDQDLAGKNVQLAGRIVFQFSFSVETSRSGTQSVERGHSDKKGGQRNICVDEKI